MSFVLDNSVTMRWFFGDGKPRELAYAQNVLQAISSEQAMVPAIWGLEVANVLARAEAGGLVTEARSSSFLEILDGLDITEDFITFEHAFSGTLQLARRYKLSAYDAAYLELALRLGLPMATLDKDLLKAAQKTGIGRFAGNAT